MKRTSIYLMAAILCLSLTLAACRDSARDGLQRLLVEVAADDGTVDAADWERITAFLDGHKARFKDFYHGDRLDTDAVEDYIEDFFEHRRPPRKIRFTGIGGDIRVNFYLERSGSMVPYDAPQGDGSFKAAIVRLLNALPGDGGRMFVVNSTITPYPRGIRQFVKDGDIFSSTKGMGDASYTDFGQIFDNILNKTKAGELSILVTDLIYSTRQMAGASPQKVFAEAQGMTASVFKDEVRRKSLLVVKMQGSYNGPYYAWNAPQAGTAYNGRRPYYIIVVGDNDIMARITQDDSYRTFSDFASLPGYENMYLFDTDDVYEPYHSLLLAGKDVRGRFRPARGQDSRITDIDDVRPDKNSGDVQLELAVDLSRMLIDKDYLTDVRNYRIESDDPVTLKAIRPVGKDDETPRERKYLGTATHIFVLNIPQLSHTQEVDIKLLNRLPGWVMQSNDDDDTTVEPATTFGLRYLMQGIYDSYARNAEGQPCYFELDLNLGK